MVKEALEEPGDPLVSGLEKSSWMANDWASRAVYAVKERDLFFERYRHGTERR